MTRLLLAAAELATTVVQGFDRPPSQIIPASRTRHTRAQPHTHRSLPPEDPVNIPRRLALTGGLTGLSLAAGTSAAQGSTSAAQGNPPPGASWSTSAPRAKRRFVDLSHPLEEGVPTFPGFPTPVFTHYVSFEDSRTSIAQGREYAIDYVTFVAGSSTYIDAPRHFNHAGADIAAYALAELVDLPAIVIPVPAHGRREYRPSDFKGRDVRGRAVLLATGWDRKWATTAYPTGSPYLGPDAARHLVAAGAALVGIDAVLIDDVDDPNPRPLREAHFNLLGAGIPIVENMANLTSLPSDGFHVTAVPAAVRGVGSFPVRAFAALT